MRGRSSVTIQRIHQTAAVAPLYPDRMDEVVVVGDLHARRTSAGFYMVSIGSTSAFIGTISPLDLPWFAAFSLPSPEAREPTFLGVEPSIEGALALFAAPR